MTSWWQYVMTSKSCSSSIATFISLGSIPFFVVMDFPRMKLIPRSSHCCVAKMSGLDSEVSLIAHIGAACVSEGRIKCIIMLALMWRGIASFCNIGLIANMVGLALMLDCLSTILCKLKV